VSEVMIESQPAILASALTKKFPSVPKPAVQNLDLSILQGESVAFLGPNGAGKSTTIKMLCGILRPDSGSAFILGHAAGSKLANITLGLVFGARSQLYFHMTVIQCLQLQAAVYFVYGKEQENRINLLGEIFQARHLFQKRVRELSLGERMRCEIIASLIHNPKVILLDEPTIGLDINVKLKLRESLKDWQARERTTLLLTSHDLSDVEALCSRCILINNGIKSFDGKLSEVRGDLSGIRRIQLLLSEPQIKSTDLPKGLKELSVESNLEKAYEFHLDEMPLVSVMEYISQKYGNYLKDIQIADVTLEEIIQKHYGNAL
jgi:ABC-2 type transport system ATP-binding protein